VWDESRIDGQRCSAQRLRHDVATVEAAPWILQALPSERDFIGPLEIEESKQ
jgi:hypothetical protein